MILIKSPSGQLRIFAGLEGVSNNNFFTDEACIVGPVYRITVDTVDLLFFADTDDFWVKKFVKASLVPTQQPSSQPSVQPSSAPSLQYSLYASSV